MQSDGKDYTEDFLEAMTVLDEYSEEKIEDVIAKENIVDTYDDKLSAYLTKLKQPEFILQRQSEGNITASLPDRF